MRKPMIRIIFMLSLLLLLFGCNNVVESEIEPDRGNQGDYGNPHKIFIRPLPDDQRDVAFGLIGDTHIDASYAGLVPHVEWHWYGPVTTWDHCYRDTPHMLRNRDVVRCLNIDLANTSNCHGIIHVGDMVNANNTQNLVAFRQLYECGYPGNDGGAIAGVPDNSYNAYSQGYKVNKTVFPSIGNHDDPFWSNGSHDWHESYSYIHDSIKDADGIISHYYNDGQAYAWRWGQYYFIVLGMWAGSGKHESDTYISYEKLHWLKDFLANHVGDSELGVLIFQHYGWDNFSTENRWWNSHMRELELDVLCRRDWNDPSYQPARPYNVLGIFTGHCHNSHHFNIYAGQDSHGNDVNFKNIIVDDAGAESNYGFSIVHLYGDSLKVSTKKCHNNTWSHWSMPTHVGL